MKPIVSIVVPVYNAMKYIKETIESVEGQTFEDWEILLVDDGSNDGTREYLKSIECKNIRVFFQKENAGAAKARNKGIVEAEGKYIAFLDADDLWDSNKLEKQICFMEKNHVNFSFTNYEFGTESAEPTGHIVHVPKEITYEQALKNTTIFTSTVMLDVEMLGKDMIKMPDVKSEDTATWWKILKLGISAYGLQENLVVYRRPAKSLSSNKFEAIKRIWNLYRKQEKIGLISSVINFVCWAFNSTKRRIS
jgi:teichuronic acid biosynthesis glycosyltransferase TuaG